MGVWKTGAKAWLWKGSTLNCMEFYGGKKAGTDGICCLGLLVCKGRQTHRVLDGADYLELPVVQHLTGWIY